jgi:hypothetical protein
MMPMGQEQGLAAQGAGMGPDPQMIAEVVEMLRMGRSPTELAEMGVPIDVIEMAMMQLQQEMQQQPAEQPMGGGLAASQGLLG